MKLNRDERRTCQHYARRGANGNVGCLDCPLVISQEECLCKANISQAEWDAMQKVEVKHNA